MSDLLFGFAGGVTAAFGLAVAIISTAGAGVLNTERGDSRNYHVPLNEDVLETVLERCDQEGVRPAWETVDGVE